MRVSQRNPPAVQLISFHLSTVQWLWLCWHQSVQNRGTFTHTASFTTPGADKEWQFYCSDCWPELGTSSNPVICPEVPSVKHTGFGSVWISSGSACQRGPRCDLWWMRWKNLTLHERESASISITFLHHSFFLCVLKHTFQNYTKANIIFAPYLINTV